MKNQDVPECNKKTAPFPSTNFTAKRAEGTIWYRFLGLGYNKIANLNLNYFSNSLISLSKLPL